MDKYPAHKLASLCQRMPLDVYVYIDAGELGGQHAIRVVKSEFADSLKAMDGRLKIAALLSLDGIYIQF